MKVTLYMAMTLNGFIAKENDNVDFVSRASWASYRSIIQKTKNVIVGERTYTLMGAAGDLEGLADIQIVVVSDKADFTAKPPAIAASSPSAALSLLKSKGFKEALVAGGGTLNGSFMKDGLIDEIYIDLEPVIFGNGIKLFGEHSFDEKLELLESKQLTPDEVQLHYRVLK